jgi:hypothetical protein
LIVGVIVEGLRLVVLLREVSKSLGDTDIRNVDHGHFVLDLAVDLVPPFLTSLDAALLASVSDSMYWEVLVQQERGIDKVVIPLKRGTRDLPECPGHLQFYP